ncbi:mannose-6-phosphate isomerase [Dactylonectria estremocensis]|uniref:Mannose-6-phosphate isomerase n=1 Tax=Dactylonectria estremocensis TaxID=1079267 RepID=A0A9P9J3S2_9HYPO|nr:mannose-6-phosphate isomerase [Dactylonectria estremocensis]
MSSDLVFQLRGTCNNYDWGKKGSQSLAAQLCSKTSGDDFVIHDDKIYSEMWFGDYPNFPARVAETGELLADRIYNKSSMLGEAGIKKFGGRLPFLPKILSIGKPLPLQIHPNKNLAAKLHKQDPDQFTDANHKPEIAVALTEFKAFVGWRTLKEIAEVFNLAALSTFVPENVSSWTNETLRAVIRNILHAEDATIREVLEVLERTPRNELGKSDYVLDLLPGLKEQFVSHDPANLVAPLCMNYLVLQPGEALFIPADGIHAYISGDILECMARSDNMLATGFCGPRVDKSTIDTFSDTMTFKGCSRKDVELPKEKAHQASRGKTSIYSPPVEEFDILVTELEKAEKEFIVGATGPSIAIATKGKGTLQADGKSFDVEEGHIYYIAPEVDTTWESGKEGLQVFTAVA